MAACGQLVGQVNDKTRRKERIQRAKIEAQSIQETLEIDSSVSTK